MNITSEDKQLVLETFREYPSGLSLIELSRKSGINRNKSSKIAEELYRKGILSLYHKSPSKIYALKKQSSIQILIDAITEPVLIINESARVTAINQNYAEQYHIDATDVSGELLHDTLKPPYRNFYDSIIQDLAGTEGQTNKYQTDEGNQICTTLCITQPENKPSLIIILHQDQNQKKNNYRENLLQKTIYDISIAIPEILRSDSWKAAYSEIAKVLHSRLPEHLFITLLIDEQIKTSIIHTVHLPETTKKTELSELMQEIEKNRITNFSETSVLPYKNNQPVYIYTEIPEPLKDSPVPPVLQKTCKEMKISSLSFMGFCINNHLEGIIGIGSKDNTQSPLTYSELLHSLSGYLTTIRTIYKNNEDTLNIANGYKKHYSEIYSLLTEKTEEYLENKTEVTELHALLGTILNSLNILFIGVSEEGALMEINKTALKTFDIQEKTVLANPPIQALFPEDLTASFTRYLTGPEKEKNNVFEYTQCSTGISYQWYLVTLKSHKKPEVVLFVGEKSPAPLICYLKSHPIEDQVITGIKNRYS